MKSAVFAIMVLLCHGAVGACIMAATATDIVTGSRYLAKLRRDDARLDRTELW